jgi:hypothetical protein
MSMMISHDELLRGALQKMKRSLSSTRELAHWKVAPARRTYVVLLRETFSQFWSLITAGVHAKPWTENHLAVLIRIEVFSQVNWSTTIAIA